MSDFLVTIFLIGLALLWVLAWRRQRRFAVGTMVGAIIAVIAIWVIRPHEMQHMPIWLPALPFALVALTLFFFGVLAWIWGED